MEVIVDATIKARNEHIFNEVCQVLKERNYVVRIGRVPGKPKSSYRKAFKGVPCVEEILSKKTKLMVIWWTKRGVWNKYTKVPKVILFKGLLPNTWMLDKGLLSHSVLVDLFPGVLSNCFDGQCQEWASNYRDNIVKCNISRRQQPDKTEMNLPKDFVFLPMQYSKDFSIKAHCPYSYEYFMEKVAKFCSRNNLELVVKHHPDILNNPKKREWRTKEFNYVNSLLKKFKKKLKSRITVQGGSIHDLLCKCKFMVGMNTMTHMDAIINGNISFHCGTSPFMNSGAVVHDNDINRGLNDCMNMFPHDKDKIIRHQKALIYYLYNNYSILFPGSMISKYNNIEKIGYFWNNYAGIKL